MAFNIIFLSGLTLLTPGSVLYPGAVNQPLTWNNYYKEQPNLPSLKITQADLANHISNISLLNEQTCFFEFRYSGKLLFSSPIGPDDYFNRVGINIDIENNSPIINPVRRTIYTKLSNQVLNNGEQVGFFRIPLRTLFGIDEIDRNKEITLSLFVDKWQFSNVTDATFYYEAFVNFRINENFEETLLNANDNGYNMGYESGFQVGFDTGKGSVTCAGVEQQSVFDLIKSAFEAPISLFNIQILPGLSLGALLLLPVAIAVLFAIWRLLT